MRVASGLDSLVLGEPQILGQVKKAFAESQREQSLSGELERLFQKSFSVAKRVRTETEIGASAVSVAFAACTLARQIFESLADLNVLLVGAGETIELVARHLREHQVKHMIIANRTRERAQLLADEVGAEVITLPEIDARLADADIIISSTASPLPIIGKGMGLGMLVLPLGISLAGGDGLVAFKWIVISYVLQSIGELLISPIGYAMIGKLAPARYQGVMMGCWMMVTGVGSVLAGYVSGLMPENSGSTPLLTNPGYSHIFSLLGWGAAGVGVALLILIPLLRRLIQRA